MSLLRFAVTSQRAMLALFASFITLAVSSNALQAATITQWTFDSSPPDASVATGTELPAVGSGTFSLVGGVTATYATGNGGGTDNSGRNTTGYPTTNVSSRTRGVEFAVSTVGFNNIGFAFDLRHSNTSANTVVVQYSTDGATFVDFTTFVATVGDTFISRSVDFSAVSALNNNANAKFRVLSSFATGGTSYVAASPTGTYGGGTMRYDNVIISGTALGNTDTAPSVTAIAPANGSTNVPVNTTIAITFSEAVDVGANGVSLVCGNPGTAIALNTLPAANVTTLTLTPASALPNAASCTVTVFASQVQDRDGSIDSMLTNFVASFTTANLVANNTAPTIAPTTGANTRLSLSPTSPGFVSGVISDPTDPASVTGISFTIADAETASTALTVSASSSNANVVPNVNLALSGTGANRILRITPVGVGISVITVNVSDGELTSSYAINYAASAASVSPANSRFVTGACDASSAVALDAANLLVANDEDQQLRLYPRGSSGFFSNQFDFSNSLALTDFSGGVPREVDLEASTRVGNRIYWLGSHSNAASGANRPNRSRLYATDISGTGATATLSFVGYYAGLKTDLIAWDQANGHGLGANALGFAASTAAGVIPEATDGSGFNIEGLTIAPDGSTGYLAFRAPLQNTTLRNRALIVTVTNFASLVSGAPASGPATFGAPIFLDLGGRAIRSIDRNSANEYLILAGPAAGATGVSPSDFRLYRWNGQTSAAPELFATNLTARGVVGSFEGVVDVPNPLVQGARVELVVDTGDTDFYATGTACKDLSSAAHKKARIESFELSGPVVRIHTVQGSGATSPLVGQAVTVEGIVTAAFQGANQLGGFFIQEPDALADANPLTSEGIFVFNTTTPVQVGDLVRVSAAVVEFTSGTGSATQLASSGNTPIAITVLSSGNALPALVDVSLPLADVNDLERYEGMRVRFPQTLTVTENFNLARFGELVLADARQIQPTNVIDPNDNPASGNTFTGSSNVAQVASAQSLVARSRIILDDASTVQNPAVIPYWDTANNTLRVGSTSSNVTGILAFGFGSYRIQPTVAPTFTFASRPTAPPNVGGTIKVASFNVLNYFNGNGTNQEGAAGGFPTARGAQTYAEFVRQRAKIIAAINTMNADAVGLMEMENDGSNSASAIADLVAGLNAASSANTWAYVSDPANLGATAGGTDQIKVAIIYKPASLSIDRSTLLCDDPAFSNGRTPTAQTFRSIANGGRFTMVVNHFKSKSTSTAPTGNDIDTGDGQGAYNASRRAQALALNSCVASWRDTIGDSDFLLLGDFNAYAQEDPIDALRGAGNVVLDEAGYSYVFDGQSGALDHAIASTSLNAQVVGAAAWHINADEPRILDYNVEFKNTPGCTNGANCTSPDFYSATPFRSSDHDPVLVGLNLNADPAVVSFDIDGVNGCTSDIDSVLVLRYLLGFRSTALTDGLTISNTAPRSSPDQIATYLDSILGALDLDEDGSRLATTDALIFARYTLGVRGDDLTAGIARARATGGFKTSAAIAAFLDARCIAPATQ